MTTSFPIEDILNSPSKLAVLRVLASRKGFKATGREIAKRSGYSVPSTHEALKYLHVRDILTLDIIGRQHIYMLNENNRIVLKVIHPVFRIEGGFKEELAGFLLDRMKRARIKALVDSLILFGSAQKGQTRPESDIDVAVVVKKLSQINRVSDIFLSEIAPSFKAYFGAQLDPYLKSSSEFRDLLKKNKPPVSTLIRSYSVLYGKEPLEI